VSPVPGTSPGSSRSGSGGPGSGGPAGGPGRPAASAKTTVAELGVDPGALDWKRSGDGDGVIEIAFLPADAAAGAEGAGSVWVLMRVAGDPAARILIYDRHEWECFLDGVRNGEFDDAAGPPAS
jgi:uncharacterized protein DUF397